MKNYQIIQSVEVVGSRTYKVGGMLGDREIIEIRQAGIEFENCIHSEFHIFDQDDRLILSIENCPVVVSWTYIAEHEK